LEKPKQNQVVVVVQEEALIQYLMYLQIHKHKLEFLQILLLLLHLKQKNHLQILEKKNEE
jgi:hypothetical protein